MPADDGPTGRAEPVNVERRRWLGRGARIAAVLGLAPMRLVGATARASTLPDPEAAGRIAVAGGEIWYRINGRRHFAHGRAPLLVLHGGPGASHHYLLPLLSLADERPVILYDQLDCGGASHPGSRANWTVSRFVSEIDALRNALGLDRLITFGSSCGATWAAEYAMRQPAGLLGSVLASPFLSGPRWHTDAMRLREALPPAVRATLAAHEAAGTTHSDDYHTADLVWIKRHVCRLDPFPDYVIRTLEQFNAELYGHMWGPSESRLSGTLADYDATSRLAGISSPVLYTCGEFDEATPASTAAFAALTPGAEITVFAGASHMPHAEAAAANTARLRQFFARVDGT